MNTHSRAIIPTVVLLSLLAGCGGSGSPSTGPLTLRVTDAPLSLADIADVCVDFDRITVHYAGQEDVFLDYEPEPTQVSPETHCADGLWDGSGPVPPVRLDKLGGRLTVALVDSLRIPVGRITWIRLHFTDRSYVDDNGGGQYPLRCPSCEPTDQNGGRGFKLNRTFEVTSDGLAVTVDVDLRKSMYRDNGGYFLRPTARIGLDDTLGTIAGEVQEDVITAQEGSLFAGGDTDTGCSVYVFENADATVDDHYDPAPDDTVDPSPVFSSASVRYDPNSSTGYGYAAGALPEGAYTVALTCDLDDAATDEDLAFSDPQNADVTAGQTTRKDF